MQFVTDAALGKLGRYLRAAGFDTLCRHEFRPGELCLDALDPERIILTRTLMVKMRYRNRPMVFIRDNDPMQQMIQVVRELDIGPGDLRPFSRCLACNRVIRRIDREMVKDRVPAYVWQRHQIFRTCGQCRRIYWAGSHHNRMSGQLAAIFQQKEEPTHAC